MLNTWRLLTLGGFPSFSGMMKAVASHLDGPRTKIGLFWLVNPAQQVWILFSFLSEARYSVLLKSLLSDTVSRLILLLTFFVGCHSYILNFTVIISFVFSELHPMVMVCEMSCCSESRVRHVFMSYYFI